RHHRLIRIVNRADNSAGLNLRESRAGNKQKDQETECDFHSKFSSWQGAASPGPGFRRKGTTNLRPKSRCIGSPATARERSVARGDSPTVSPGEGSRRPPACSQQVRPAHHVASARQMGENLANASDTGGEMCTR